MRINLDCAQIQTLLKADYLDNEIESSVKDQIDRHLEQCPACRGSKENLEAISQTLRRAPRQKIPESLWPRIQADLRRQHVPKVKPSGIFQADIRKPFLMMPSFVAAAAAILILISAAFYLETLRPAKNGAAPNLTSLSDNDEIREPDASFGSYIEEYLL